MLDNPKTALSVFREHTGEFDLVLAELYMPEMDGLELLQIVNSELKIPVVCECNSRIGFAEFFFILLNTFFFVLCIQSCLRMLTWI